MPGRPEKQTAFDDYVAGERTLGAVFPLRAGEPQHRFQLVRMTL